MYIYIYIYICIHLLLSLCFAIYGLTYDTIHHIIPTTCCHTLRLPEVPFRSYSALQVWVREYHTINHIVTTIQYMLYAIITYTCIYGT